MAFIEAAVVVGSAVGLEGTAALIGGGALMGAGAGALYSGITGDGNILNSALLGGALGGGAAYGLGAMGAGAAAPAASEVVAAPLTGANVAGTAAIPSGGGAFVPTAGSGASFAVPTSYVPTAIPAAFTPAEYASQYAVQDLEGAMLNAGDVEAQVGGFYGGQAPANPYANMSDAQLTKVLQEGSSSGITAGDVFKAKTASDVAKGEIPSWAKYGAGALGLGYLMNQNNKQYGVTNAAPYTGGSLAGLKYDRTKYTPLTTAQPNPPYSAQYANYIKNPYNPYAAKGGRVVSMAQGGIAGTNSSVGPVEQMSRDNATGNNQMFPQAAVNSDAFSSATNRPLAQNMLASASDTNVDPYTGAERFAMGGLASTKRYADGGAITPDQITANSVNYNNALMAQLQGALNTPAQSGMPLQQVPFQTPLVAPQQYQGYGAPSFTRSTPVNIPFANPNVITGTKEYNDKVAAEEAARMQPLGGPIQDFGGGKAGGLMPKALRYAPGGKIPNHMEAIDKYIAQYQSDPAAVTAKAKSGDYNAMIALNKINDTPNQNYAAGGHLGSYSDGGRMLKGPGDGMSDNIPATIGGKQPARLADGEFVVPADVVSHLGNGSTDAGAKHLYNMMDKVRKARTGSKKQGKQIKPEKYLKG